MAKSKLFIIYCSVHHHTIPPFSWYRSAQKLSESCPVIFIDLPANDNAKDVRSFYWFLKWLFQKLFNRQQFCVWDLHFFLSKYFLRFYTFLLKDIIGYQVVLITNASGPQEIYRHILRNKSYFECTDKYDSNEFRTHESFIKKFNGIFTNTSLLYSEMKKIHSKVYRISSGYSENLRYELSSSFRIPNSVVFSGGITIRIDYAFLQKIVKILPKYQFFFLGKYFLDEEYLDKKQAQRCQKLWQELLKSSNVLYLGEFSPEESKQLLSLFEYGIIPYVSSDTFNHYSHPVKFYEYLAAGLTIISTTIPSVLEYKDKLSNLLLSDNPSLLPKQLLSKKRVQSQKTLQKYLDLQSDKKKIKDILAIVQ